MNHRISKHVRKTIALISTFIVILLFSLNVQSANEVQSEANFSKVCSEVEVIESETIGNEFPEVVKHDNQVIGTDLVKVMFYEKGEEVPQLVNLSHPLRKVIAYLKGEIIKPNSFQTNLAKNSEMVEKLELFGDLEIEEPNVVERLVDMYVCMDVATVHDAPNGEVVESVNFATKYQASLKGRDGWRKIKISEEKVGYIKTENLMSSNQMLNNFQYLFAQILYAEAGGIGKDEMRLVGEVVLNRLITDYWEFEPYCNTLEGVLSQSGQYPDTLRKIRNGLTPSEEALEVAKSLLLGEYERLLPEDCLWQTGSYPLWNVEVVRYPGEWYLEEDMVINVYHYYSKLAD